MAEINPEMTLTLCVISNHNQILKDKSQCFFQASGGTIGSDKKSKWFLPNSEDKEEQKSHPILPSHAEITFGENVFFFEPLVEGLEIQRMDVLMEEKDTLTKGTKTELRNGDYLTIGPYQVLAAIHDETLETMAAKLEERKAEAKKLADDAHRQIEEALKQFEEPEMEDKPESEKPIEDEAHAQAPTPAEPEVTSIPENAHHLGGEAPSSLDPLELLGVSGATAASGAATLSPEPSISNQLQEEANNPLSQSVQSAGFIPEDWHSLDELDAEPKAPTAPAAAPTATAEPSIAQPPVTAVAPVVASPAPADTTDSPDTSMLACRKIFEAAGLDVNMVSMLDADNALNSIALMLKASLQGLLDNIQAMDQLQKSLKMDQSAFPSNVFSQSLDGSDAILNLLIKKTGQAPESAISETAKLVSAHQKALDESMQSAFADFINSQSPSVLEKEFEQSSKSNITDLALGKKRKYWDSYKAYYNHLSKDGTEAFQRHFASAFNKAYVELVRRNS